MKKNKNSPQEPCKIHVMPPAITDSDITALFNGLLNIVKKKIELDSKAQLITLNMDTQKLMDQLKEKQAECNRLKNEVLRLTSELNKINN